jgi:integrase
VNFLRREIHPAVQWPADPLKTAMARESIPIADALVTEISAQLARWPGQTVLGQAAPWTVEREIRKARAKIDGLPDVFQFHDLRHYYASLLIAWGAEGGPASPTRHLGEDHAGHLRALMAGLRQVHEIRRRAGHVATCCRISVEP